MKQFIQKLLINKARKVIATHKPKIVAITGSVGKTSTTNAVYAVLSKKYRVRMPRENYNNEFGVPLTILGQKSPGSSAFGWLKVLFSSVKDVPDVYVLEYGADRPGDIRFLCDIAKPDVAIMTAVTPVHAEHFGSIEELTREKASLLEGLTADGLAVLNVDDERVRAVAEAHVGPKSTYGFSPEADVRATSYQLKTREDFSFDPGEVFAESWFHVETRENEADFLLKNAMGRSQVSSALAAIAVGAHLGLTLEEMVASLMEHQAPPGRLRPLPGIKGSLILDDSYNAAPASVIAALEVLKEFHPAENRRRIAVLGNMAELGQYSESEHRGVGMRAVETGVDLLVCVGEKAHDIAKAAKEAGMEAEHVFEFPTSRDAGRWLDGEVKKGDIVLVKGSQSMRMEFIVKELMADPASAEKLLVRQYGKWLKDYEN